MWNSRVSMGQECVGLTFPLHFLWGKKIQNLYMEKSLSFQLLVTFPPKKSEPVPGSESLVVIMWCESPLNIPPEIQVRDRQGQLLTDGDYVNLLKKLCHFVHNAWWVRTSITALKKQHLSNYRSHIFRFTGGNRGKHVKIKPEQKKHTDLNVMMCTITTACCVKWHWSGFMPALLGSTRQRKSKPSLWWYCGISVWKGFMTENGV